MCFSLKKKTFIDIHTMVSPEGILVEDLLGLMLYGNLIVQELRVPRFT